MPHSTVTRSNARRRVVPSGDEAGKGAVQAPISAVYSPTSAVYSPISVAYSPISASQAPISVAYSPISASQAPTSAVTGRSCIPEHARVLTVTRNVSKNTCTC